MTLAQKTRIDPDPGFCWKSQYCKYSSEKFGQGNAHNIHLC